MRTTCASPRGGHRCETQIKSWPSRPAERCTRLAANEGEERNLQEFRRRRILNEGRSVPETLDFANRKVLDGAVKERLTAMRSTILRISSM
jgi:hypothetical protein